MRAYFLASADFYLWLLRYSEQENAGDAGATTSPPLTDFIFHWWKVEAESPGARAVAGCSSTDARVKGYHENGCSSMTCSWSGMK